MGATGEPSVSKILVEGGFDARYAPTGHLVFVRARALFAVPFDLENLEVTGAPVPVLDGIYVSTVVDLPQFAFSQDGTLAYVAGPPGLEDRTLVWVDRNGTETALPFPARPYCDPNISPDGKRLAISIQGENQDIWIYELASATMTRLTFEAAPDMAAVWMPDGKSLTFASGVSPTTIYRKPADGGPAEEIVRSEVLAFPLSYSPDGRTLVLHTYRAGTGADIEALELGDQRDPDPLLSSVRYEWMAQLSPDGRWLAYVTNETGRSEIYVQEFPGPGGRWQVSTDGGEEPRWARNGREIFYRNGDSLMAVPIETEAGFKAGKPRVILTGHFADPGVVLDYDVAPDGERFLMIKTDPEQDQAMEIQAVPNWFEELKRLVPMESD
jgi:serine/threonine-protein kinase